MIEGQQNGASRDSRSNLRPSPEARPSRVRHDTDRLMAMDPIQRAKLREVEALRRTKVVGNPDLADVQDELNSSESIDFAERDAEKQAEQSELAEIGDRIFKHVKEGIMSTRGKKIEPSVEVKHVKPMENKFVLGELGEVEEAQKDYLRAYLDYDPMYVNKIFDANPSFNHQASEDLMAIIRPPRRAIFSSDGRELRRKFKRLQDAIKAAGEVHDKRVESNQIEEKEWQDAIRDAKEKSSTKSE